MKRYIKHEYENEKDYGIYFMLEDGSAMCRVYGFYDNSDYMVLDCLTVKEKHRKKGIGTKLQEIREEVARKKGCKHVFLWVKENSWMQEWYIRRGYVTKDAYLEEEGSVWMKKELTRVDGKNL